MRLLLDTNALMWTIEGNKRLGRHALSLIEDPRNEVLFTMVSIWEIIIKIRVGKLQHDWRKLMASASVAGLRRISVAPDHFDVLDSLAFHHGDPFDHMIIAQAIAEEAKIVTSDTNMMRYDVPIVECS